MAEEDFDWDADDFDPDTGFKNKEGGDGEDFDWDADDFDPEAGFKNKEGGDEWAGEDEGLDTEALKEPPPEEAPKAKKPTKEERIAEKKAKRRAEELQQQESEVKSKPRSAVEDLEEKLKQQRLQEESDLAVAMETFGVRHKLIDTMEPKSEEEFSEFQELLTTKISNFKASPHYMKFMEKLIISTCKDLDVEDLRHLSTTLSTLATEKQKAKAPKASKKKQVKASLGQVGKGTKKMNMGYGDDDNDLGADFDDFM